MDTKIKNETAYLNDDNLRCQKNRGMNPLAVRHQQLLQQLHETYIQKNTAYGDSFHVTYADLGIMSAITRISDKYNRVKTLAHNNNINIGDEAIIDTLLDLANYCIMTVMEIERETLSER